MASAKQRAAQDALKAFVKRHGRAPRKGESTMAGAGKSTSVTKSPSKKGRVRRAASRARSGISNARGAAVRAVGPQRPLMHALAVTAGGAAAPYAESIVQGGGTMAKVATGYLTGSPGLQDTGLFEAGARIVQGFAQGPLAPGSGYGRTA